MSPLLAPCTVHQWDVLQSAVHCSPLGTATYGYHSRFDSHCQSRCQQGSLLGTGCTSSAHDPCLIPHPSRLARSVEPRPRAPYLSFCLSRAHAGVVDDLHGADFVPDTPSGEVRVTGDDHGEQHWWLTDH